MEGNNKYNPFIPIADNLSGALFIFLFLFVVLAILPKFQAQFQEKKTMENIKKDFRKYENNGYITVSVKENSIMIHDVDFSLGSSCVKPDYLDVINNIASKIKQILDKNKNLTILIDGHSDANKITVPVVKSCGGFFTNNMQLSTLRAMEVRNIIINRIGKSYESRIGVAGYGDTRLLDKNNPYSPKNRYVNIKFVWRAL